MTFLPLSQKCQMHFLLSSAKPAVSDQHTHHCHISMSNTASPSSAKVTSLPSKIPFSLHSNQNVRQGYRRLKWGQQGTLLKKVSILSWRLFFNFRPGETETDSRPDTGGASNALGKICHHSTKGESATKYQTLGCKQCFWKHLPSEWKYIPQKGSLPRRIPVEKRFRKIASRFRY